MDYVPTLFCYTSEDQKRRLQKEVERHERVLQMNKRRMLSKSTSSASIVATSEPLNPHVKSVNPDIEPHDHDVESPDHDVEPQHHDVESAQHDVESLYHNVEPPNLNIRVCSTTDHAPEMVELKLKVQSEQQKREAAEAEVAVLKNKLKLVDHNLSELREEIDCIKATQLTNETLQHNDKMVLFYTGLPSYETLKLVYDLALNVLPRVCPHGNRKLDNFSECVLTLVKLRLNLRNTDLGYRFGVSESVVTQTVHKWLNVLYVALKFLIRWPSRDEVRATIPECFRESFLKAVVIIDCTEVFIERATNLLARSQTWSNYKSHNTVKYLIGITPQGSISFVSQAWGGRVSDKTITQECGILSKLLPGDLVLADRGFNIMELVEQYKATVQLPAFTKGKSQLTAKEVHQSRELARVRIHVERLIGLVKQKYTILEGILPISFIKDGSDITVADKLMVVCCALVNLCHSIVPVD